MKTNRSARKIRKLRIAILCLAIAVLAGVEVSVGQSLAARFGQTAVRQTQGPQAPNVDLSAMMVAMR
jgi:hypothetical protein